MNKLDKFLMNSKTKAQIALAGMKSKATGDETLIIKIMLIVIAVVLVILFRDTLADIVNSILEQVKTNVEGMFDGVGGAPAGGGGE